MTQDDIKRLMSTMFQEELKEHQCKSADYSSPEDGLSNFRTTGEELNIDAFKVWYIFFKKHVDAIACYCSGENLKSESIQERIKDCRVYLVLLRALIEDKTSFMMCVELNKFREGTSNAKIND